jgi:hypothetical protein
MAAQQAKIASRQDPIPGLEVTELPAHVPQVLALDAPTTRRYPRTLVEAFPQDGWAWLEVYRRPLAERIADALLAIVIGVAMAAALVHWWSA